jgi:hypothetical protein
MEGAASRGSTGGKEKSNMTGKNLETTTTSKVAVNAVDYSGEDAESIKACAPDAADYTERKDYNRARKAYDNAVWELAHPTEAKAKRVKGRMTPEQVQEAIKDIALDSVPDTMKVAVTELVAAGATERDAFVKVLTYNYNYHLKGMAKAERWLAIAESTL